MNQKFDLKYKNITDSSFCEEKKTAFIFSNENKIDQLAQELIYGQPTCFLISGYRGVGKSSFIGKLEDTVICKSPNTVFIRVNFSKFEKHTLLLRKLFRELYLTLDSPKSITIAENQVEFNLMEEIRLQNRPLEQEIKLLYERTFLEVSDQRKNTSTNEKLWQRTFEISYREILLRVSSIFLVILGLGLSINTFSYIGIILLIIPELLKSFVVTRKKEKKESYQEETNRKTLYDDEIAEHHFIRILKKLYDLNINCIFVIDELDKIENPAEVQELIAQTKPLLLSGLANFIVVSGQQLYYRYYQSHINDDDVVASIFSKALHIPLFSVSDFFSLTSNILSKEEDLRNSSLELYIKAKILQSNRLPRRFLHLIRQDLFWQGKTASIQISDNDLSSLDTDAQLMDIISSIEQEEMDIYKDGIRDFLIFQLHRWIQKIKLNYIGKFQLEEIFDLNAYRKEYEFCIADITHLSSILVNKLTDKELLDEEELEDVEETKTYYSWKKELLINNTSLEKIKGKGTDRFLKDFIEFESFVRRLFERSNPSGRKSTLRKIIKELMDNNTLSNDDANWNYLSEIFTARNKIAHGEILSKNDYSISQDYKTTFSKIKSTLAEEHAYKEIQHFFTNFNYTLIRERRDASVDFMAKTDNHLPDFLFEIKSPDNLNASYAKKTLYYLSNYLESYDQITNKKNYTILIVYDFNNKNIDNLISINKTDNIMIWKIDNENTLMNHLDSLKNYFT